MPNLGSCYVEHPPNGGRGGGEGGGSPANLYFLDKKLMISSSLQQGGKEGGRDAGSFTSLCRQETILFCPEYTTVGWLHRYTVQYVNNTMYVPRKQTNNPGNKHTNI